MFFLNILLRVNICRPTNQDSPFKIIGDEMEYIDEKSIKTEKIDEYFDKNVAVRNNNFTAEGNQADDFDDDGCTADDDFEDDGMFELFIYVGCPINKVQKYTE